jgi:hypothetical protein
VPPPIAAKDNHLEICRGFETSCFQAIRRGLGQ